MSACTWTLLIATFLNALMAGFLFAFAVVVMPGIRNLNDRDYLRSFQAMDRVIQKGQPLFMAMWLGSTVTLIAAAVFAMMQLDGTERVLVVAAALASIFLVQLPTMTINIPLNNNVQALDCDSLNDAAASQAREAFEMRWNRWNVIRTVVSCAILAMLLACLAI
ncbi:MAG: DUF1772 domain-containing protein [Lacipirellulaceae bacterium]